MSDDQIIGPGGEPTEPTEPTESPDLSSHAQDSPARLLSLLSASTPVGRGEWGQAMLAELDQVNGPRARWQFAIGSARAMMIPLLLSRLGLLALAAMIAGGLLMIAVDPDSAHVEVFLIPEALCLCALAAAAEPAPGRGRQRSRARRASRIAQTAVLAVIAACLALSVHMLTRYPGRPDSGGSVWAGAFVLGAFALQLSTYAVLAVRRCEPLAGWRGAGIPGLAAALVVGGVFQLSQPPGGLSTNLAYPVVSRVLVATVLAAPIAAGVLAALLDRGSQSHGPGLTHRLRSGAGELAWGWLLCAPVVFLVSLLATPGSAIAAEAAQPSTSMVASQAGATSVLAWVSADDLGGAIVMFSLLFTAGLLSFLVIHAVARAAQPNPPAAVLPAAPEPPAAPAGQ
jgi:hypothetical protein